MIYDLSDLRGFKIITLTGEIGTAHDFYFSSNDWKILYLMCDAGYQMTDRIVIFYKDAIVRIEYDNKKIFLNLNKDKIFKSPYIGSYSVVTKLKRKSLHEYYGWSKYWENENYLEELQKEKDQPDSGIKRKNNGIESVDGLNCTREIINQVVIAEGKEIGLIKNILMESSNWKISYMLINQYKSEKDKKLVIKPSWIKSFKGDEEKIELDRSLSKVSAAPEIESADDITREVESQWIKVQKK
jgi:sporulation protein YlmC with PRC-barrel domain